MRPLLALIIAMCLGWLGGKMWLREPRTPATPPSQKPVSAGVPGGANAAGGITHPSSAPINASAPADPVAALTARLSSVGKDSLRAQSELYATLQNFTAEDFQRFTSDPEAFEKLMDSLDQSWFVRSAFVPGFIERWIEVDEQAAFAWFKARPKLKAGNQVDRLAAATLSRLRPDAMLAHVLTLPEGNDRKNMAMGLMTAIGATDLEKAKQWVGRFEDRTTRDAAEIGYLAAWAKVDPFGAVAEASLLPAQKSGTVWRGAMSEAARRGSIAARSLAEKATTPAQISIATRALAGLDPAAAAQLIAENAEKFPGELDSSITHELGTEYAIADLDGARAWADALPGKLRIAALGAISQVWASTDPQAALAWLDDHPARESGEGGAPPEQGEDASTKVLSAWLGRDEAAARAYATSLPAGEARDAADAALINHLSQNGRTAEAAALLTQSENLQSGALAGRVAEAMAQDDPVAAATWAASLPPGANQTMAVKAAASAWAGRDPVSVAGWIEEFPAGEVRDRAVGAYAGSIAGMDPSAAAAWVLEVSDPWYRATTAEAVFWQMRQHDPAGADRWFSNVPGVDETVRRTTLQDAR